MVRSHQGSPPFSRNIACVLLIAHAGSELNAAEGELMRNLVCILIGVLLTACVRTSTMPLAADTLMITSSAAPACGQRGAQEVVIRQAAIETIKAGYDGFVVLDGNSQSSVGIVGHTPVTAQTYGQATAMGYGNTASAYGSSTTTYSGGYPIYGGTHDQSLVVKMFRAADPASANAVDARQFLGSDWEKIIEGSNNTCM